jgi:uracil-DNA glycosylase
LLVPPSLRNVYKELAEDIPGFRTPAHGYLQAWASQGVLMLNAVLTVEEKKPNSHESKGWETFTDAVINYLARTQSNLVFLLWGAYAQKKGKGIDQARIP